MGCDYRPDYPPEERTCSTCGEVFMDSFPFSRHRYDSERDCVKYLRKQIEELRADVKILRDGGKVRDSDSPSAYDLGAVAQAQRKHKRRPL